MFSKMRRASAAVPTALSQSFSATIWPSPPAEPPSDPSADRVTKPHRMRRRIRHAQVIRLSTGVWCSVQQFANALPAGGRNKQVSERRSGRDRLLRRLGDLHQLHQVAAHDLGDVLFFEVG